MYLWGEVSQNSTYIDAGAYGFTTEMEAIEQYWFDYDETNWLGDHPDRVADQAYDYPFQEQVRFMALQWGMEHILVDSLCMYTVSSGYLFLNTLQTMV